MRKILLLSILPFFAAAQKPVKIYSARAEYGLKGNVKEMNNYICTVKNKEIPADTTDYMGKQTMTFDKPGNAIATIKLWKPLFRNDINRTYEMFFSGKGRDVSYKTRSVFLADEVQESDYQYQWMDEFSYKIINKSDIADLQIIRLDKNFRLAEIVTELKNGTLCTDRIETVYKNDRIERIITRSTEKTATKTNTSISIWVVKAYDQNGNPSIQYIYNDADEQDLKNVIFKTYTYY